MLLLYARPYPNSPPCLIWNKPITVPGIHLRIPSQSNFANECGTKSSSFISELSGYCKVRSRCVFPIELQSWRLTRSDTF